MKVLMITVDESGGVLQYTSQLSNELSRYNQTTVIAPTKSNEELFNNSVKLIRIPVVRTKGDFLRYSTNVKKQHKFLMIVQAEQPDIIHFQNAFNLWAALFLLWLRNIPVVTTLHDIEPPLGGKRFYRTIARNLHLRYSHCLITHSESLRRLLNPAIREKCYTIPHGDYSFYLKYNVANPQQDQPRDNVILFFGRIAYYKGLEYLLHAAPLISKEIRNSKIVIAGAGDLTRYLRLIRNINTNNIQIYNRFVPYEDVPKFFREAKVVVLPYVDGSQTGIIPIAYAFGKPVIATNVGGITEVVDNGKTGLIIPPRDVDALSESIIRLLTDDDLREEMGRNAYRKMKEELSWDKIARRTIEVYRKAINICANQRIT